MSGPQRLAWVNGHLVRSSDAAVSLHDRGLRTGEGVFTTIRVASGRAIDLEAHLARTREGLRHLGLPAPPAGVMAAAVADLVDATEPATTSRAAVRLLVTPGPVDPAGGWPPQPHRAAVPTVAATIHPLPPVTDALTRVDAVTSTLRRPLPRVKSTSWVVESLALRTARMVGAEDAVFVDDHRQVLEAATAAVVVLLGDTAVAHPEDGLVLPSTSLPRLLAAVEEQGGTVERRALHLAELRAAGALLLVSAVAGVRLVEHLDGGPATGGTTVLDPSELAAAFERRAGG